MTFPSSSDKICAVKSNKFTLLLLLVVSFAANVIHSPYGSASENFDFSCLEQTSTISQDTVSAREHAIECNDQDHQHEDQHNGASHDCKHGHVHSILVNEHRLVFFEVDSEASISAVPLLLTRTIEAPYRPPIS